MSRKKKSTHVRQKSAKPRSTKLSNEVHADALLRAALDAVRDENLGSAARLTASALTYLLAPSETREALSGAAPDLLKAAQLQILNFQRQDNGDTFLGEDDHEAWTALANAVKKATSVPSGGHL